MATIDIIDQILPRWMLLEPRTQWRALMSGFAFLTDGMQRLIYDGRLAAMPGQVNVPGVPGMGGFNSIDALPLVGRDRGVRKGEMETWWDYASNLRRWMELWTLAATPYGLLEQLAAMLSPDPGILRLVTPGGVWWTRWSDGAYTMQTSAGVGFDWNPATGAVAFNGGTAHAWDWDSASLPTPPDQNDPGRFWVICYVPNTSPLMTANDGTFNDPGLFDDYYNDLASYGAGPSPNAGTIGLNAPRRWVDSVTTIINEWRSAGIQCSHVIVSFDATAFNPATDSTPTSIPDGSWGWHSHFDAGDNWRRPTRFANAEYIRGQ